MNIIASSGATEPAMQQPRTQTPFSMARAWSSVLQM